MSDIIMKKFTLIIVKLSMLISCNSKNLERVEDINDKSKDNIIQVEPESSVFKISPVSETDLYQTIWINKISDECYDSLIFNSLDSVGYYSCEDRIYYNSSFVIEHDTIMIDKTEFIPQLDGSKKMISGITKWKLVKSDTELKFVKILYLDEIELKWIEPKNLVYNELSFFQIN